MRCPHDAGLHIRSNTAASASGPLAIEAALANFANSGISMPELFGDGEESLGGELDHIDSVIEPSPSKMEPGAAAEKLAMILLVEDPTARNDASQEVCSK